MYLLRLFFFSGGQWPLANVEKVKRRECFAAATPPYINDSLIDSPAITQGSLMLCRSSST